MSTSSNVNIKVNVDTTQFDNSLKGMKKELLELQKVDLTLLSEQDAKAVLQRMGQLRDSIRDLTNDIKRADPGALFNSFITLSTPAISAISTMSVGLRAFGVESEKVNKIQSQMMVIISALSTLQSISDAKKYKALVQQLPLQYQELKNRITNTLLIKQETVSVVANTAAKETGGITIKKLTILQKLWNAAVSANPIGLIILGIAALAAAVYGLSRAFRKNTDEVKESQRAMDGTIIKSDEMRNAHNAHIKTLRDLDLELQKVNGTLTDQEYEIRKIENATKDLTYELDNEFNKSVEESAEKMFGFWNIAKNTFTSFGGVFGGLRKSFKQFNTEVEKLADERNKKNIKNIEVEQRQIKVEIERGQEKIRQMMKQMADNQVSDEREKLRRIRDERLMDIDKTKADEQLKADARKAVYEDYLFSIKKLDEAEYERVRQLREKLLKDLTDWRDGIKEAEMTDQGKELAILQKQYSDFKEQLDMLFPVDSKTGFRQGLEQYEIALKDLNETTDFYTKKIIKKYDELNEKAIYDFRLENNLVSLEVIYQRELEYLEKLIDEYEISYEEAEIIRLNLQEKYEQIRYDNERKSLNRLSDLGVDTNKQMLDLELRQLQKSLQSGLISQDRYKKLEHDLKLKYDEEYFNEYNKMLDLQHEIRIEKERLLYDSINGVMNLFEDNMRVRHQDEQKRLSDRYNKEKQMLDDQLKFGIRSQYEYDQDLRTLQEEQEERERKLKTKQAKDEKKMALFQVGMDTAAAVVKTLAKFGIPLGLPLAAIAAAQGAVQAGLIAAKKIPQFRYGSKTPFDRTGLAYLHQGEMVMRPEVVDKNVDILKALNERPDLDLAKLQQPSMSPREIMEYITVSFEKYSEIPVVVREHQITETQEKVRNIRVNSETN